MRVGGQERKRRAKPALVAPHGIGAAMGVHPMGEAYINKMDLTLEDPLENHTTSPQVASLLPIESSYLRSVSLATARGR